jgi:hypothetical protein
MKASPKQRFEDALASLLKVSHGEMKQMLDAEKAEKKQKRKPKTSASVRARRAGKG